MHEPPEHRERVERSREDIRGAIAPASDVTFVRGAGNLGDELIWAGARTLLDGVMSREISIEELGAAEGELAVLAGSGALCRPWHEWKPHAIAIAELRFERVIVLPSSVDLGEDRVRDALTRTRATVFAREPDSLRAIENLCDARLALDSAFHFDYSPYADGGGAGTLNAFRTDAERARVQAPPGSEDISATCGSLREWLRRIAAAERVRTDRAHVMIAAALLGKPVEYAASSYHKLPAIAGWALSGFPVERISITAPDAAPRQAKPTRGWRWPRPAPAVGSCAVIATRDRPEQAAASVASVLETPGTTAVVVDANSAPESRRRLTALLPRDRVRLVALERNPGRAGARTAGLAVAQPGPVLLLDEGVTMAPRALVELARALDRDPEAAAVTATVVGPDATVEHSGGSLTCEGELARFDLAGAGASVGAVAPSGPCEWAPHSALLARAETLERLPPAADVPGFDDIEWALRAREEGLRILRSAEATAVRVAPMPDPAHAVPFAERMRRIELATSLARIHERRGVVVDSVFALLPRLGGDPRRATALFAELLERGPHAVLADWDAGRLAPILGGSA